jgi:hypothetical protein
MATQPSFFSPISAWGVFCLHSRVLDVHVCIHESGKETACFSLPTCWVCMIHKHEKLKFTLISYLARMRIKRWIVIVLNTPQVAAYICVCMYISDVWLKVREIGDGKG